MAFDTAANIIASAAVELGLVAFNAKPTDPFAETNPNIGQLCQLLIAVGRNLVRAHQWTALQNTWVFTTVANNGLYGLPGDFDSVIDQTGWNRTNRLPLGGPVSPQIFEALKGRVVGTTYNLLWRMLQGNFQAFPDDTTTGGYTIAYEYMSRWWAVPAGTQVATAGPWVPNVSYSSVTPDYVLSGGNIYRCTTSGKSGTTASLVGTGAGIVDGTCVWQYVSVAGQDSTTAKGDVVQFDSTLVVDALELEWLKAKDLDATAALADYQHSLEMAMNADIVAPVLHLDGGGLSEPLLGLDNLPSMGH